MHLTNASAKKAAARRARSEEEEDCDDDYYEETQRFSNETRRNTNRSGSNGYKSTGLESDEEMDFDGRGSATYEEEEEQQVGNLEGEVSNYKAHIQQPQNELKMAKTKELLADGSRPWWTKKKCKLQNFGMCSADRLPLSFQFWHLLLANLCAVASYFMTNSPNDNCSKRKT